MRERLDRFMARANAAYYASQDPFADFTTAPEISQAFGEILGLWAAVTWQMMGCPAPVLLAEAGPGRGTLMTDALRAISQVAPAFRAALELHLVETSPRLREAQASRLSGAVWHDSVERLPPGPLLLVANEFLDALPIRQIVRRGYCWAERFVEDGRFIEVAHDNPLPQPPPTKGGGGVASPDAIREICEPALSLARHLGERLVEQGGAALFIDYGPEHSTEGDSLQAIRDGKPADPLADPGTADLTAHVDFAAFAQAARQAGAAVHGPVPQGLFLARLGLFQRTDRLARGLHPAKALELITAARRLAEPDGMGRLFKTLAVCHPGLPISPGFES